MFLLFPMYSFFFWLCDSDIQFANRSPHVLFMGQTTTNNSIQIIIMIMIKLVIMMTVTLIITRTRTRTTYNNICI